MDELKLHSSSRSLLSTEKQIQQIRKAIANFIRLHSRAPSLQELADEAKMQVTNIKSAISQLIKQFEEQQETRAGMAYLKTLRMIMAADNSEPVYSKPVSFEEGLWTQCFGCREILYIEDLKKNLSVCPRCRYHFRISAWERIEQLADGKQFEELFWELLPADPLKFVVEDTYPERLEAAAARSGLTEALVTGLCKIKGHDVALGVMSFDFFGGSMGCVVGEKIARLVETACAKSLPIVIVASSGGARMHEGIFSLMQLGKISSAFSVFNEGRGFFISVLTEPVFGSAAASFGMIGDVILAEPGARIGFAGRRVVESTINQTLPRDFQTAEYLLEHGQIDMVVPRAELADTIARLIKIHCGANTA